MQEIMKSGDSGHTSLRAYFAKQSKLLPETEIASSPRALLAMKFFSTLPGFLINNVEILYERE